MTEQRDPRVIVALDYANPADALNFVERLEPGTCRLKVGKELFTRGGPQLVEKLVTAGYPVFLDLKFHDIPNTVAGACRAAADLGVWMMNVHASGGRRMMEAAREAVEASGSERPLLIAVTVLTSMAEADLQEIGITVSPAEQVSRLAALTAASGLDGVVCSPLEVAQLRADQGDDFLLVTPGVRPAGGEVGDQRRIMTPGDAVAAGSSYLVVGRPVTQAPDPLQALAAINQEVAG